jgi:hypothetical protein
MWLVQGVPDMELLEPGHPVDYVWDDLALDRRLVICIVGKRCVSKSFLRPFLGVGRLATVGRENGCSSSEDSVSMCLHRVVCSWIMLVTILVGLVGGRGLLGQHAD